MNLLKNELSEVSSSSKLKDQWNPKWAKQTRKASYIPARKENLASRTDLSIWLEFLKQSDSNTPGDCWSGLDLES